MGDEGADLAEAVRVLEALGPGKQLTTRIAQLEEAFRELPAAAIPGRLVDERLGEATLRGALQVKALAGQINVVVHAVGILVALPHILDADETVQALSLGAGNAGGRAHDLVTDRQVAEFKFIQWRGDADGGRQSSLFADVFNLASEETDKRRVLYVTGKVHPLRFLTNNRTLASVLSRNRGVAERLRAAHGEGFTTVSQYWDLVKDRLEIVDLCEVVPALKGDL